MSNQSQPFAVQAARFGIYAPIVALVIGVLTLANRGEPSVALAIASINLLLILAGFVLSIVALASMRQAGTDGILGRGIVGLVLNGLVLLVVGSAWIQIHNRASAKSLVPGRWEMVSNPQGSSVSMEIRFNADGTFHMSGEAMPTPFIAIGGQWTQNPKALIELTFQSVEVGDPASVGKQIGLGVVRSVDDRRLVLATQNGDEVYRRLSDDAAGPSMPDLAAYRTQHPTHLLRHGPPPEIWQDPTPLKRLAGVQEVTYDSNGLALKAWMSTAPTDGKSHPAVVFCHGGFWFGNEDWDAIKPFLNAGFVVLMPRVRGENGNPGEFEFYYGEVDDVIAAGRYVAAQKGIDPARIFISGHSAGGALAALAAMKDNPFAMSAPIGAQLDIHGAPKWPDARHRQLIVFNVNDRNELNARSALLFAPRFRTPLHLFLGRLDGPGGVEKLLVEAATFFHHPASLTIVEGDHGQSLTTAIPQIIRLFQGFHPPQ